MAALTTGSMDCGSNTNIAALMTAPTTAAPNMAAPTMAAPLTVAELMMTTDLSTIYILQQPQL